MSETILNWLNTQINLSKKNINIEEEFANGYYFGKIFESNHLFNNIKDLKNTIKKEDSLRNYSILGKIFDLIGLHLTEIDINELLNKKKYKAELFLYKIKQKLSLKNFKFDEIIVKIRRAKESKESLLKVKRNQSAKLMLSNYKKISKANNIFSYTDRNKNGEGTNEIKKIYFHDYISRLQSAKLHSLKKGKINGSLNGDNNKMDINDENLEKKQIQSVLNDIKVFEKLHMKKIPINEKEKENNRNPWDEISFIYNNDSMSLFNRDKKNEEKKKAKIFDLIDPEYKKEKEKEKKLNKISVEAQIKKIKSTLHNHNRFKIDYKKSYINKINLERNLFQMGINFTSALPSISKIRDKNISSELVMKSINDSLRDKKLPKKYLLNYNSTKNKSFYMPSKLDKENEKESKENSNLKRPSSCSIIYNYKTPKNKKLNNDEEAKQAKQRSSLSAKRPLTSKKVKNNFKSVEKLQNLMNSQKKMSVKEKFLSKIMESESNDEEYMNQSSKNIDSMKSKNEDSEDSFFKSLHKGKRRTIILKTEEQKKEERKINMKNIKEIIHTIIDVSEVLDNFQQTKGEELIDLTIWKNIAEKFIYNKQIIKRKRTIQIVEEKEIETHNFDFYDSIDEEYSRNFGLYEINEMKNYLNQVGNKYDSNKNNLFFNKLNIKEDTLEINDVMGDEIQLLFDKAKNEKRPEIDEDDEDEYKKQTRKNLYRPVKQELEILEPNTFKTPEYSFTKLISELIEFKYKKDLNIVISSKEKMEKDVTGVIEEYKKENSFNTKNNEEEEKLNKKESKENKKEGKNNINITNDINNNNENLISFKDIIDSIPLKISFVGLLNNEIKTAIKNLVNKFPKIKIYNPREFLDDLKQKKKKMDESSMDEHEQNLRIKKEKSNSFEEIKDYIELVDNKDNLTDDEIYIKILQKKIREDFGVKNIEDIKQEIIKKREEVNKINSELNKEKEEHEKKQGNTNIKGLQVLQQQLDKIDIDSMNGFIIINFPNNFEQSKLMEEKMVNFIQPCEKNKLPLENIKDTLLLLCDKEQKDSKFIKFNSFLEKIIYFYCDKSKLISEKTLAQNPNPVTPKDKNADVGEPPMEDAQGEFTKEQIDEYILKFKEMEEFYQNFNIQIDKYDYYEGMIEESNQQNGNNNNNLNIFTTRDRAIIEKIKDAQNIYEEKLIPKNNISLLLEESDEDLDDGMQLKEKESSRKASGDSSIKDSINNNSKQQVIPKKKESNISVVKNNNNDFSKTNSNNNDLLISPKNNYRLTTQNLIASNNKPKILLSTTSISDEEKMNLFQIWDKFNTQYIYYCKRLFYKERIEKRRMAFDDELDDLQKTFIEFLSNSKEQEILIQQFIQKYKVFRERYCKFFKTKNASYITVIKNFQKDLHELGDSLWTMAKIRKNQGFEEIDKIVKENHVQSELIVCYYKMEHLTILETQKLITIINILIRYSTLIVNQKITTTKTQSQLTLNLEVSDEIMKNLNSEEYVKGNDKKITYPRANRIYKNCFKVLIKIFLFLENYYTKIGIKDKKSNMTSNYKTTKYRMPNKTKNLYGSKNSLNTLLQNNNSIKLDLQNHIKSIIKTYIGKYKYNIRNLYLNTLEDLSKMYCPFKQIIKLMDKWIILSMELQNKNINENMTKLDVTKKYTRKNSNNIQKNEQIEKNIVDLLIKDDHNNDIINFKYKGINPDNFELFDVNKFLGISTDEWSWVGGERNAIDVDALKIYDFFKEFDVLNKLRNNEIQKGIITKAKFEEIFFKYFLFENLDKFPKAFKNITFHNISHFLSYFTIFSSEFNKKNKNNDNRNIPMELLYTNDVVTILLLSGVPFKVKYKINDNNEIYINKDKFMEINIGFENEVRKIIFDKSKDFKLFLFNINKNGNENPEINIKKFLNLLSLKTIKKEPKNEIKKYFDFFYI